MMIDVIGVVFRNKKRVYYFSPYKEVLSVGDKVIVSTEKGLQFGTVELEKHEIESSKIKGDVKPIIRKADEQDEIKHNKNIEEARKALLNARNIVENKKMNMYITSAEYTLGKEQLMFKL